MKPIRVVMGVAAILLILVFVQGVQAAEIILRNDLR
jgi:hypothetical protein